MLFECVCVSVVLAVRLPSTVYATLDLNMYVFMVSSLQNSDIQYRNLSIFTFEVFIMHVSNLYSNFLISQNFHKMCYGYCCWNWVRMSGGNIVNVYKWSDEKRWLCIYILCVCVGLDDVTIKWWMYCSEMWHQHPVRHTCVCVYVWVCGWIPQFGLECWMTIQLTRKSTFNFQQAIGFSVKLSIRLFMTPYLLSPIGCDFVVIPCFNNIFQANTQTPR